MVWATASSATQLAVTSTGYETVQKGGSDWEITLNPGELAQIVFEVNTSTTATENTDIIIPTTVDGTTYESDGEAQRLIIEYDNSESDNPAIRSHTIAGIYGFQIRARLRDTDDTVGGDDSAKGTTLDVDIAKDNVNI